MTEHEPKQIISPELQNRITEHFLQENVLEEVSDRLYEVVERLIIQSGTDELNQVIDLSMGSLIAVTEYSEINLWVSSMIKMGYSSEDIIKVWDLRNLKKEESEKHIDD